MYRAIDLANLGVGKVSPNPLVGCVVVHEGRIIGEGWHAEFGQPHAEVNAINAVRDSGLLPESTVYVNLEPCTFYGKTPPCTDLLIESKVKRVVIGTHDPNSKISGAGIQKLEEHGIEVTEGILFNEGKELNRRFFVNQTKNRPFIILKWAQTADGFIAKENYHSRWISSEESRKLVHKWRSEEDAILVGRITARFDNPHLDVRDWCGKNPIRVVLDPENKLPDDLNIKDKSIPSLIYNLRKQSNDKNLVYIKISDKSGGSKFLQYVLNDMFSRHIGSLLIEGGGKTLQGFIESGLWDEARVFTSLNTKFEKGIPAPKLKCVFKSRTEIGNDLLEIYRNEEN